MTEQGSSSARESLLLKFDKKQRAFFLFLENITKIQKRAISSNERIINEAPLNYGVSVEETLEELLNGGYPGDLPLPTKDKYEFLSWIQYEQLGEDEYTPSISSIDLRLIEFSADGFQAIKVFANRGSLEGTEHWWAEACDVDYPMIVEDRAGFRYMNAAYYREEESKNSDHRQK